MGNMKWTFHKEKSFAINYLILLKTYFEFTKLSKIVDLTHSFPMHSFSRSSHWRCSVKIGVLKNYTKSTGRHLCQSVFYNKVAGLRSATLFKKRVWHRCFPVSFGKFLRTPFEQNTSGRLPLFLYVLWTR